MNTFKIESTNRNIHKNTDIHKTTLKNKVKTQKVSKKNKSTNNNYPQDILAKKQKLPNGRFGHRWYEIQTGINTYAIKSIKYAEDATLDNPIMCLDDGSNRIEINKINPRNANKLEMMMYCAHLDSIGKGNGNRFGTWNSLQFTFDSIWDKNSNGKANPTIENLTSNKIDWIGATEKYLKILVQNNKSQYLMLKKIYDTIITDFKIK